MKQAGFTRPTLFHQEKIIVINSMLKSLALCGLTVLLAGTASAQGDDHFGHPGMHPARHAIMRQKAAYARAVAHGNYGAAERAHLRAKAIRHHVRTRREMHHDMHMDHGY